MPENYVKSLDELLEREYGVKCYVRVNPLVEEVNIAVTQIVGANPKRLGLMIMNLSANLIYIAPDQQPAAARGIRLQNNGGSITFVWNQDFSLVARPWWGTAAADNSDIITTEVLLY